MSARQFWCSAVTWKAGRGRSDPRLNNFQHCEYSLSEAGHSPGAVLWLRLRIWSRVTSRMAVQTDLDQSNQIHCIDTNPLAVNTPKLQ
jgi:hypothetical protein